MSVTRCSIAAIKKRPHEGPHTEWKVIPLKCKYTNLGFVTPFGERMIYFSAIPAYLSYSLCSASSDLIRKRSQSLFCGHFFAKLAFPLRHHGGREAVPYNVYCCAPHVHQRINAENEEDRLLGQMKDR